MAWFLFLFNHRGAFEELEMGKIKIQCRYAQNSQGIIANIFKTSTASSTISVCMKLSLAANDFGWDECLNFYFGKSLIESSFTFQASPITFD